MPEALTKSKFQWLGIGFLIAVALIVLVVVIDRFNASQYQLATTHSTVPSTPILTTKGITDIELPKELTIFGEPMPLDNWDIRERFEREFYYNWNNASQIVIWWQRSGRYFAGIEKMLRDAGLPTDLEYLAIAESGLANVKSPANANGFWQFIPQTAQRFGLRVDDLIDERLDPVKSTRAAVAYLKYMRSLLPSWTLVAAGYNMGEDNVAQALQWQHAGSYWDLFVNDETMRYVFRIAAIKELITHADRYGLNLSKLTPYRMPQVRYVAVRGPIASIADWAYSQGYLYKDIKVLNPWLIGRSIPSGTYNIAVPSTDEDRAAPK